MDGSTRWSTLRGGAIAGAVEDTPPALAFEQLQVNLLGAFHVSRGALPWLRRSAPGLLIHVSSIAGAIPLPFQALYCASKSGLEGLCEALRLEAEPHGVRVVVIRPGSVVTGMGAARRTPPASEAYREAAARALAVNDRDEAAGVSAVDVGRAVAAVLEGRDRRECLAVGWFSERLPVLARRWLPARWIRRGVAAHFDL